MPYRKIDTHVSRLSSRTKHGLVIGAVFALLGIIGLQASRAATYVATSEAEAGVVAGNTTTGPISGASGNQAVTFGNAAPPAPANVQAITGGNNIALLWDATAENIPAYEVYRNGAKVATIQVGSGVLKSDRQGTRYIDKAVSRGTTYRYQVRAVSAAGTPSPLTAQVAATHPATVRTPVPNVTFDTAGATDVTAYVRDYMKPEIETWYPKVADAIAYPEYPVFGGTVHIFVDPAYGGAAEVGGSLPAGHIRVNPAFLRNQSDGAEGMMIHEATHIIQGYNAASSPTTWVTEGIADWAREWFMRERYKVKTAKLSLNLNAGTAEASYVLEWGKRYDRDFVRKINVAVRKGTYSNNFVASLTGGRTPDQLHTELRNEYYGQDGRITGIAGKCVDVLNGDSVNGAKLQLATCNNTGAQRWKRVYKDAGLNAGLNGNTKTRFYLMNNSIGAADGKCVDVAFAGTASGTKVHSWACALNHIERAQMWTAGPNSSLVNPNSGKCLSTTNGGSEDGNQLIIATCDGSAGQRWTVPQ